MTQISQVHHIAEQVGKWLEQHHLQLTTAESCTGGQLAQTITSVPGSSKWFERGFISYSNLAKQELLSVKKTTLQQYGAASQETAKENGRRCPKNESCRYQYRYHWHCRP